VRFCEWVSTGAWTEQSSSSSPLLKEIPSLCSSTLSDDLINGQEGMCESLKGSWQAGARLMRACLSSGSVWPEPVNAQNKFSLNHLQVAHPDYLAIDTQVFHPSNAGGRRRPDIRFAAAWSEPYVYDLVNCVKP